jgi:hypothetical protein
MKTETRNLVLIHNMCYYLLTVHLHSQFGWLFEHSTPWEANSYLGGQEIIFIHTFYILLYMPLICILSIK